MNEISRTALRPLSDSSPSTVVAGFIAMLTGYTSSLVLMFQAGQAAGLSTAQISSWIWALSIGMAICSIGLSLRYRTPVVVAWSTPGAALLITSLPGVPYAEAIGAFIFASALIALCGLTGSFDRLMRRVPASLAAALLAGVLFNIGSEIFRAVEVQPVLVLGMFFSYLLAKRMQPRYAVLAALLVGCLIAGISGLLDFQRFSLQVAVPVWTTPAFSLAAIFSIGIPLFVIAMASQNMPGLAVLRAEGYQVPASPLIYLHHRHRFGTAGAVRLPRHSSGGDHHGHLRRPRSSSRPAKTLYRSCLVRGVLRHCRHLWRNPGRAVRRLPRGTGVVRRRAGIARLDRLGADPGDAAARRARGSADYLHGHGVGADAVRHRRGAVGIDRRCNHLADSAPS